MPRFRRGPKTIKTMDKNLYLAIIRAVATIKDSDDQPVIRHIDLWNRNIEFIEQDQPWQRPAVFVEFMPAQWQHLKPSPGTATRHIMKSQATLRLHVVTDWHPLTTAEATPSSMALYHSDTDTTPDRFDITTLIAKAVMPISGDTFSHLLLTESAYSHDHEDIVEDILTFTYTAWRQW